MLSTRIGETAVQTFDTIADARKAVALFNFASLPTEIATKAIDFVASPSPVDQIVKTGEYLYAEKASITSDALSLAGGLIAFATINGWHGLLDGDRGNKIVQAVRRTLGETPPTGLSWPDAADDPAPLGMFES